MEAEDFIDQLRDVAQRLENHFEDICDIDFTVQDGKLYVLNARIARRTPAAAIRIATDLFLEGRITGKTLITRIAPEHIQAVLRPTVELTSNTRRLGSGLPASAGAATGLLALSSDSVLRFQSAGSQVVFMSDEFVPDDIQAMEAAVGLVSFRGGMTSHAAVVARGFGTPCVAGVGWSLSRVKRVVITPRGLLHEGDPVTIDGTSGAVFEGSASLKVPNAMENDRLVLIYRIMDALAAEDELPDGHVGRAWSIRDLITHGPIALHHPDVEGQVRDWPRGPTSHGRYAACSTLMPMQVRELGRKLKSFSISPEDIEDFVYLWAGLRGCLLRLLAKHVGLGRHPLFYRPLFDPCHAIVDPTEWATPIRSSDARIQYVGEEFFAINHHVPEYIEIGSIRLYWVVACEGPWELWRLDRTNPSGEKLLQGSPNICALKVVVNDTAVALTELPRLYTYLRRKEYFWDWYRAHGVSRNEIINMLTDLAQKRVTSSTGNIGLLVGAGLLSADGSATNVGKSLLHGSSARERAGKCVKVGW